MMGVLSRETQLAAVVAAFFAAGVAPVVAAPTDEQKAAQKVEAIETGVAPELRLAPADMTWWQDAKLGLFVHWGLYAIPAKGEWHMFNDHVSAEEYAKLAQQFTAKRYDPEAWAAVARAAGAGYMVMTARHHDGFALFDSPSSYGHFDAMHAAAHRDVFAAYVAAARKVGLRVGVYYSPLDWRFPAYFHIKEMPENAALFKKQTYDQIEELMRKYGPIDVLWYDGGWLAHQGTDADAAWFWHPEILNAMVRRWQPKVVINPRSGWQGDFNTEEGFAPISGPIRAKPWEKCVTLNRKGWGYTVEQDLLNLSQLQRYFVDAVVRNGNLLVNVGPDADGSIPPAQVALLRDFGAWTHRYGESFFATRPGPFAPVDGVYGSTNRGGTVYVHILSWPKETLHLPSLPQKVVGSQNLTGGAAHVRQDEQGIEISVPLNARDAVDTIIRLDTAG